ncbi:HlyD family type I secretion periplasmic adaptor subunit [Herbaspirillum sp. AP02]|uniref:HlyD family type I secretion periplasmic adaptor subunit n=1 Tax=unclassified Herbaspirillum TaxID=2624150 RepID=UPI0015DA6F55|nr:MULTISPECIES: HlyD family type I secretion periplasmic adaptor subunit [unclassified Herbaspirillum]MBG7618659.1 HlyD family type I secretion periplasmic adaptor subunit [Herbaspirillum sp. AP02]NZD67539.1 HlyD family type I secretion periplasmic adaptor subunit [Herbaspirillum sp. AP21]
MTLSLKPGADHGIASRGKGFMRRVAPRLDRRLGQLHAMPRPRLAVLACALLLALLVLWSILAPIDMVVRGSGRIVASEHNQVIQHLEGGIVSAILVREGAVVKKGQTLISIADVRANADLGEGRVKILGLRARMARLSAESSGAASLQMPADLERDDPAVQSEQAAFAARAAKLTQEMSVLREQAAQRQGELGEAVSRQKSQASEVDLAQRQYKLIHNMLERNAASQLEDIQAAARVQDAQSRLAATDAMIPRLKAAIAESQAKMGEASSRFRSDARTDLTATENELARLQEEIKSRNDRVSRSEVKAPMDGVVNRVMINTVGGVVRPGDPIIEMTPSDDKLVIEARISPTDRAELVTGARARVKVSAYDYGVYGAMEGVVTEISADTVPDENNQRGERSYRIKIAVQRGDSALQRKLDLMPGMTASADIIVGRRTVWQYLMSPLSRFGQGALREPR